MRTPQKRTVLCGIRAGNCQWWGNMVLMPVKMDGGGYTHLQSSDSKISSTAGVSVSTSLMVMMDEGWGNPRPITPNWHVIMLMVVVPYTSWTILLTSTVDLPARVGPVPPPVEVRTSGFSSGCWQSLQTLAEVFMVELWYSPVGSPL